MMTQQARREYLIRALWAERAPGEAVAMPESEDAQKRLLRALMNVRPPKPVDDAFLAVQDAYLSEVVQARGVVSIDEATDCGDGVSLWQGDITRLSADAIVNAANSGMTGCYVPNHACIDNCIHTYAGVQLRLYCHALMQRQGHEEPTGQAKYTPAYNLPCKAVLHTVGPIVEGIVTARDEALLADCYRACLLLAEEKGLSSVAFCCISTGVFHFPNRPAAEIAVDTVRRFLAARAAKLRVVFNVFKDEDYAIYRDLLG